MSKVLIARLRDDRRLRRRFARVERLLRARDTSNLLPEIRAARTRTLDHLRQYYRQGIFPRNTSHEGQHRPVFIDGEGRACAVAYLMLASGQEPLARRIARDANEAYIRQMPFRELDAWAVQSGLTKDELAFIQPSYPCTFMPQLYHLNGELNGLVTIAYVVAGAGLVATAMNVWTLMRRRLQRFAVVVSLVTAIGLFLLTVLQYQTIQAMGQYIDIQRYMNSGAFYYDPCPQSATAARLLSGFTNGINGGALMVAWILVVFSALAVGLHIRRTRQERSAL